MQKQIHELSKYYNTDQNVLIEFQCRKADKTILPPANINEDLQVCFDEHLKSQLSHDETITLFKAFHFVKFKICQLHQSGHTNNERYDLYCNIFLKIRTKLVNANVGLVISILKKTHIYGDYSTLKSEGYLALLNSIDKYDPWRGYKFSTYAYTAIARCYSKANKLYLKKYAASKKIENHYQELYNEDIYEQKYTNEFVVEKLKTILKKTKLSAIQKRILRSRFALDNHKKQTLKTLGTEYKMSHETIRKIETDTINILKDKILNDEELSEIFC